MKNEFNFPEDGNRKDPVKAIDDIKSQLESNAQPVPSCENSTSESVPVQGESEPVINVTSVSENTQSPEDEGQPSCVKPSPEGEGQPSCVNAQNESANNFEQPVTAPNNNVPTEKTVYINDQPVQVSVPVSNGYTNNSGYSYNNAYCGNEGYNGYNGYPYQEDPCQKNGFEPVQTEKKPKEKKKGFAGIAIIVAASVLIACVSCFISIYTLVNRPTVEVPTPPQTSNGGSQVTDIVVEDYSALIESILPSTVTVVVQESSQNGIGSGVIMTENGYILTNAHVIDSARSVTVITSDGKKHRAKIIGYDSSSDTGVLKIEGKYTPAKFGDSSEVKVGQTVIAIGTPCDTSLSHTATKGMVSAIRKKFAFRTLGIVADVIQHDAAISPGNSGGALFDVNGNVIGINSVKIGGEYDNLGFALQINGMLNFAQQIIEKGTVEKPLLGIKGKTDTSVGGVWIGYVYEDSASDKAGVKVDDIVIAIDGNPVATFEELSSYINEKEVGDTVVLTILRNGEKIKIKVTLMSSVES